MRWLAGAAALLALGAGLGTYFALRGSAEPQRPPKAERSAILEIATQDGIIRGYRVVRFDPRTGERSWRVAGSDIELRWPPSPCYLGSCPSALGVDVFLEFRHTEEARARRILRIAAAEVGDSRVHFGPPYYP